jgi:hypothetical protein
VIAMWVRLATTVALRSVLTAERQFAATVERGAAGSRFVKHAVTTT